MPSRNKRNKGRQNANQKNTTIVQAPESPATNVVVCKETEPSQTIKEAEEKLTELQQKVDSIKDSISLGKSIATATINANANANANTNTNEEASSVKFDEQKNEQQTMKKKRNRNRNRKKNTSNESTHESSPTNLGPITSLSAPNVTTEKITEEPHQCESNVSLEKIEVDCIESETVKAKSDKQQEISCNAVKEEIVMIPSEINIDQSSMDGDSLEKTKTNTDEIEASPQKFTVDEMKTDGNDHNVDAESLKCSTKVEKVEKLQELHNQKSNPTEKLDITITTDKKSDLGQASKKREEELKEELGKSEMKYNLSGVDKRSPKTKNKSTNNNNNNKNGKEVKKATNEGRKIEKKPPERIKATESLQKMKPIEQTPLTTSKSAHAVEESVGESETMKTEPTKITDDSIAVTSENVTQTPTSTPIVATPAPELSKKAIQHEDETAKIWKILEEASKSLEPVEIQMDDEPVTNANDPPPIGKNLPILCSSEDQQEIEEKVKDLTAMLQTMETDKVKTSEQPKPKPKIEMLQSNEKPKQTSRTKSIGSQLQKHAELTKANVKSIQENSTQSESKQQVQVQIVHEDDPVTKSTEEKHEPARESSPDNLEQQSSPTNETIETILPADDVIPLDVSILPDHIDVPEMNIDSKNVQGSGFVPSVDQTAVETKSLVLETIATSDEIELDTHSSVNSNKENTTKSMTVQAQDNDSPSVSKKSTNKDDIITKTEDLDQSMTQEKKRAHKTEKPNQTKCNPKNTHEKVPLNSKKSNGKPIIPPKPDNLVSSQMKKSQAAFTKSAKMEKILVLTGTNADDEDSEDDYIEYKFMPRPVFIATICQSCKKPTKLNDRILCQLCHMVSYCKVEHAAKDEPQHKDLCVALQEIAKKRGGHVYNNARILNDNDYRSLRVHTLNLCENFLKRPLQTYEREILLFPRLCSHTSCREWRPNLLADCSGCGQAFYCSAQPDHLVETHQRWCKSVALYKNLVVRQSVSGRIEPSLPSRIQNKPYKLPYTIGDVFKDLYKNYAVIKDECVFATLTQLATIPLTAYFAAQKAELKIGEKFTIHLIGAELQFEADVLDIWETFFLHLAHNLVELTIVFCGPELNAENIPLDIISRIRMCRTCRQHCRIVKFDFQCAKLYHDYAKSTAYSKPDLICFFNPGFHHVNSLNTFDTWSETIKVASLSDCPVVVTSYTEYESPRDLDRFQHETANNARKMDLIHGPSLNAYASQRPERNFISDEIVPVIFKNYFCFVLK